MTLSTTRAKAASHPIRLQILAALEEEEPRSPSELSQELDDALGTISYHIRVLERLGAVREVKQRQVRGAVEHFYSRTADYALLDPDHALDEIATLLRGRSSISEIVGVVRATGRRV